VIFGADKLAQALAAALQPDGRLVARLGVHRHDAAGDRHAAAMADFREIVSDRLLVGLLHAASAGTRNRLVVILDPQRPPGDRRLFRRVRKFVSDEGGPSAPTLTLSEHDIAPEGEGARVHRARCGVRRRILMQADA
jgi:hypothetical protein